MFKVRWLLAFIRGQQSEPPGAIVDGLLGEMLTLSRGRAPADDMTV